MLCKLCVVWLHPISQLCTRSIGTLAYFTSLLLKHLQSGRLSMLYSTR
jgi:hypothetical protein